MKKNIYKLLSLPALLLAPGLLAAGNPAQQSAADTAGYRDIYPDTWVATDAVGRTMPSYEEVGAVKNDQRRIVGIFYITWHTQGLAGLKSPYTADVTKILEKDPNARLQADNPLWTEGSYHYAEPEMGYFLSQDEWVIRKDISMLADAGVDVMIMDVTNAVRYWDEWDVIFKTMEKMKAEGNKVPKFCFWAFNGPVITVVQDLYERIYEKNQYPDLWFYWDGKPLLLYNGTPKYDANGQDTPHPNLHYDEDAVTNKNNPHYGDPYYTAKYYTDYSDDVKNFFTLRTMWWGYYEWANERFIGTEDNWSFGYNMADPRIKDMKPEELLSTHKGKREQAAGPASGHDDRRRTHGSRQIVVEKVRRAGAGRTRHAQIGLCALARENRKRPGELRNLFPGTLGGRPAGQPRIPVYQRLERKDRREKPSGQRQDHRLAEPRQPVLLRRPVQHGIQPGHPADERRIHG